MHLAILGVSRTYTNGVRALRDVTPGCLPQEFSTTVALPGGALAEVVS